MGAEKMPVAASGEFVMGGVAVRRLGFGAMRLTGEGIWGRPDDPAACVEVLRRAVDLGVNLIDTADSYGPEVSEDIIFEALHPYPEDLVIATKAGLVRTGPEEWWEVGRPEYLRQQCEMSLRRLGVDCLDVFQLHRIDPAVPAEEQFGVMAALQQEGKVRSLGLSEVTVAELEAAREAVDIVSVQNLYNLTNRQSEDVLSYCEAQSIGFIPWAPLADGDLARPGGPVDDVAGATGATASQVALAWLLAKSPVMLPIPGTASVAHLEENCDAAQLRLDTDQISELTAAGAAT
ncbi:MAG: aldo/keto reductase [Acidimicrobiales bacterium]